LGDQLLAARHGPARSVDEAVDDMRRFVEAGMLSRTYSRASSATCRSSVERPVGLPDRVSLSLLMSLFTTSPYLSPLSLGRQQGVDDAQDH
jgi:hypothetical protein